MTMNSNTVKQWGATWYRGSGAMLRMFSEASDKGHTCFISQQEPHNGYYFASYPDWNVALKEMKFVKGQFRNFFEIMKEAESCKPYFDLEHSYTEEEMKDIDEVAFTIKVEAAVTKVFDIEYGIVLQKEDFVWSNSKYPTKLSRHLVIHKVDPEKNTLLVFENNAHAKHSVDRLIDIDPELQNFVDQGVYGRNRSMRMLGSSKRQKNSFLMLIDRELNDENYEKSTITWLNQNYRRQYIEVPDTYRFGRQNSKRSKRKGEIPAVNDPDEPKLTWITQRIFELLCILHPSTVPNRKVLNENREIRFTYEDRTEPCYSGNIHEGERDITIQVTEANDVYAKCYSSHCIKHPVHFLGSLDEESTEWQVNAVRVNLKWLGDIMNDPTTKSTMKAFANKEIQCLNIRSYVGSGKTTWLASYISTMLPKESTILILTYRQSLAYELAGSKTIRIRIYQLSRCESRAQQSNKISESRSSDR